MLRAMLQSAFRPFEISAMLRLKFGGHVRPVPKESLEELANNLNDLDFCYAVLSKVSRSFAVVIQRLPEKLKDAVCIFYLVLRGLDTVEDDMEYDLKPKVELLRTFHEKLDDEKWTIEGVGDHEDYRTLLKYFHKVTRVYQSLAPQFQEAISRITKQMGEGMAEFAEMDDTNGIDTTENYDKYCHYVAGLVGYGLSALFSASGFEREDLATMYKISNSMGLFLQKTNIIRDYLEDQVEGRTWWPKDIWQRFTPDGAKSGLSWFGEHPKSKRSLAVLNCLIMDALRHVPDCMKYLSLLKQPEVFRFCAIPQVMAIATLAKLYNNPNVFTGVVKIRKGLTCRIMLGLKSFNEVKAWFSEFSKSILYRAVSDSDRKAVKSVVDCIEDYGDGAFRGVQKKSGFQMVSVLLLLLTLVAVAYLYFDQLTDLFIGSSTDDSVGTVTATAEGVPVN